MCVILLCNFLKINVSVREDKATSACMRCVRVIECEEVLMSVATVSEEEMIDCV